MTIAILATGDELVHGDTLNTNGHGIAHILSSEGLPLGFHLTCSDKEGDIVDGLQFLCERHDIVILIGGLGPTTDDLTRFALARFTNEPLVQHEEALTHIKNRLHARVVINEGNLQQCLFPAQATLLPNPNGSAVGCSLMWESKTFFLLPGPPSECLPMFIHYVLPALGATQRSNKEMIKWRIFGLAESEIGEALEKALANIDCQTGYRLETPYIEFKVRCAKSLVDDVKAIVDPILAPHIISPVDKTASTQLREFILSMNEPISLIDEATGGLLQTLLTKPGTQNLFNCNELKKSRLSFHLSGLQEYWAQESNKTMTQITIRYSKGTQEGSETHQLPYRSPLVVYYAAEWLSFRILQLINQLH